MVLTRVGVLGGTFDPVHLGHLEIARRARDEGGLESVVFVPAGRPRLKSSEPTASPEQRLQMLSLAVQGEPNFEVSDVEVHRSGPTLTVETLQGFCEGLEPCTEVYFILGLDVLERFDQWIEPERVVELARLLVVSRPGYTGFDWAEFYLRNPYASGRVDCIESAAIDVSASELRSRLAAGATVGGLVPEPVEQYIRGNGLYGT